MRVTKAMGRACLRDAARFAADGRCSYLSDATFFAFVETGLFQLTETYPSNRPLNTMLTALCLCAAIAEVKP